VEDRVIPAAVIREMAERIPDSRLELHAGYGHGNDMENPVYRDDVSEFVREVMGERAQG
jgi:pimeloyl-ACP methyl ester carboxylesterase